MVRSGEAARRRGGSPASSPPRALLPLPLLPLLLLLPGGAAPAPTYAWRDPASHAWLQCEQCPPGTFVERHCGPGRPTLCRPCPALHYTHYWNYLEKCLYCNVFCGEREEEAQACNATHNRACRCQPGFHAHADFCIEHSACPPGSGVLTLGTPTQNTQCQPCPTGTFSDNSSSTERCRPHRDCAALGMFLNVPGTSVHDAMCTRCASFNFLSGTQEPGNSLDLATLDVTQPAGIDEGDKECKQAMIDFVAFQNIPLKRLMRLQQALETPENQWPEPENRAAVQKELLHRLTELSETQGSSALLLRLLLQALQKAKLTTLERNIRNRFDVRD